MGDVHNYKFDNQRIPGGRIIIPLILGVSCTIYISIPLVYASVPQKIVVFTSPVSHMGLSENVGLIFPMK